MPKNTPPTFEMPPENQRDPKVNPEVNKRLDAYIAANQNDLQYYTRLVKENPDRAVRVLLLKDLNRHDNDMRLIEKQKPAAQEWYEKQKPEIRQRIDERLAKVNPFYADKAFVGEVLREMGRQNRQLLTPKAGVAVG